MMRLTGIVLRHKRLVVLAWLVIAVAGFATIGATGALSYNFSIPGQALKTDNTIQRLYHNGGFQNPGRADRDRPARHGGRAATWPRRVGCSLPPRAGRAGSAWPTGPPRAIPVSPAQAAWPASRWCSPGRARRLPPGPGRACGGSCPQRPRRAGRPASAAWPSSKPARAAARGPAP